MTLSSSWMRADLRGFGSTPLPKWDADKDQGHVPEQPPPHNLTRSFSLCQSWAQIWQRGPRTPSTGAAWVKLAPCPHCVSTGAGVYPAVSGVNSPSCMGPRPGLSLGVQHGCLNLSGT